LEEWNIIATFAKFFQHISTDTVGRFSEFNLPLKSLTEGVHTFDYKLTKQFFIDMEDADIHDADLDVHLTVTHKNELYNLDFHITGTVTLICDRCLDSLIHPIDATYTISVRYGDEYNDESDKLLEIPMSANNLNVSYMIHDTVVLDIPIKHVHPAGKCNRAMSAMLRKHRARSADPEEEDLENQLMDEIDDEPADTDPRWDALKGLSSTASDNDSDR